jgi:hypothetical protein
MVEKTGHNHPDLSWHQRLLASDTQNPFCALAVDINQSAERVGSDSTQLQAIREATKINLSRFSCDAAAPNTPNTFGNVRKPWLMVSTKTSDKNNLGWRSIISPLK